MNNILLLAGLGTLVVLSSCKDKETVSVEPTEVGETSLNLESYLLKEAPENPVAISQVFANPTPGTKVTVTGEVMGRSEPFVENRAMLVLGDPTKIIPCNRNDDDHCETPWDVCCDDPDVIKTSIATIQILDNEGMPVKEGLKGLGGIQELTTLTVVGTIAEGSNEQNLIINAEGIHVGETDEFMTKNH
ncbi:hypothetical protein AAFN60_11715 [Roseibacillus persicicus]|uniref:hypothetical protein n=1 Tax=Roseibacillus persicicus TaxID=454148 RepID=UPI00398B6E11